MQNSRLEQENIGDISNLNQNLTELDFGDMKQIELERLIELARLDRRSELVLYCSQFSILPKSLGNLTNLT